MTIPHFVYFSSVDGNWGRFHFLAIMNNSAVNISVQIFIYMYVFIVFEYIPMSGIAESCGNSTLNILRNYSPRLLYHFTFP